MTPIAVLLGAVIIAFAFAYGGGAKPAAPVADGEAIPVDIKDVSTENTPFIGNANAPVTIAVWYDYQCPFCKQFELTTLSQVEADYVASGKVKILLKDFAFLGPDSEDAAVFGRAMWEAYPDRYAEWHKTVMTAQDEEHGGFGNTETIATLTRTIAGVDVDRVLALAESKREQYVAAMTADRNEGTTFGINGTPGVIIGTTLLSGAYPYETVKPLIDAELAK